MVGCVGLVDDVRLVPSGWRAGDIVLAVVTPDELDLAAEAAAVEFLWRAAPFLSLAHDVSEGGLETCIAEAAAFSGAPAELEHVEGAVAIVAVPPQHLAKLGGVRLERIGVV